jgi:integrase
MAVRIESVHRTQLALGKHGLAKKENPTFAKFAPRYLAYSKANKPAYTVERYYIPGTLVPFFGRSRLSEITAYSLEKYKQKRLDSGLKKSSINRELGLLKSMLSSAAKWQLIDANPARDGKLFKLDEPPSTRVLTYDEETKLLAACEDPELRLRAPHLKVLITAAICTGCRRGELLRLRWADIDFDSDILTVKKSKSRAGTGRIIYLNTLLRSTLQQWRHKVDGEWVFPSSKAPGEHIGDVKNSLRRAVKISGITPVTCHQLRHTFCSRLSDAGVPIAVIQELAGHASIVMTRRYMHPANELKRKAVELVLPTKKEKRRQKKEKKAKPATKAATPAAQPEMQAQEERLQLVVQ